MVRCYDFLCGSRAYQRRSCCVCGYIHHPKKREICFCDQLLWPNAELPVGWFSFGSRPGCWRIVMGDGTWIWPGFLYQELLLCFQGPSSMCAARANWVSHPIGLGLDNRALLYLWECKLWPDGVETALGEGWFTEFTVTRAAPSFS